MTPPADLPPTNGSRPGGTTGGRPPGRREAGDPAGAVARRLDNLDQRLDKMVTNLDKVARSVGVKTGAEPPAPLDGWFLVKDPDRAITRARELADWVEAVFLRFDDAELPPCWAWHPGVVEDLLMAFETWREAYVTRPAWPAAEQWLDRTRPGVVRRLGALTTCGVEQHREGGTRAGTAPTAPLRSALDVIAPMWAVNRDMPYPTLQDRNEARDIDGLGPLRDH